MNTPFFLMIILTGLCLIFQKSKLITCLTFLFIWTLSWTDLQPDYTNYNIMYLDETSNDIGYAWLTLLSKRLGLEYFTFRLLFLAFGWFIYTWFIIKFSKRCALVSAIYLWTLALYDMEQNRNFVAFAICLLGIASLFKGQKMRYQIRFAIAVIIASTIHITCAYFLMFLVPNMGVLNKLSKFQIISISIAAAILIIYLFSNQISDKVYNYDTGVSSLTKSLLILLFFVNIIYIYIARRFNPSQRWINELNVYQRSYSFTNKDTMWLYNLSLMLLLPAAFMSLSSLRIYKYSGFLNVCYVDNRLRSRNIFINNLLEFSMIFYSGSFLLVTYMMHGLSYMFVIMPPFYNNIFYNYF